jgi:hypothetical protein
VSFDPEFQPSIGFVRGALEDIDGDITRTEANILEQRWKTLEELKTLHGRRTGLQIARGYLTKRLDDETIRRFGIKP